MSLSFFSIAGLWALLALAVPLLIHLFNRSRGRLVRIGHIDLVRQARRLRVTEIKLKQWLLLVLRLLIFTLAALLLAGLAQTGLRSSDAATRYITPAWIRTVQSTAITELIERTRGSRLIVLQPGFALLDDELADKIRQTPLELSRINNIWPLLAERLSLEHHGGTVDVYAVDFQAQFGSPRANLPRELNWHLAHPALPPGLNSQVVHVVVIYDAGRRQDAGYIHAALASIKAHRLPGLTIQSVLSGQISERHLQSDWLIVLSEKGLTNVQLARLKQHTTVLMDAGEGLQQDRQGWSTLSDFPFSTFSVNRLEMTELPDTASLLASTADGWPVLYESRSGPARILKFSSRFNPQWSSITQQAEFSELLLQLMLGAQQDTQVFAGTRINSQRLQSYHRLTGDIPLPRRSLHSLLAMLLALLWVTERWLSERNKRESG